MSVEVKTPPETQFEGSKFQCTAKRPEDLKLFPSVVKGQSGPFPVGRRNYSRQTSENIGARRKRRFSERAGGDGTRERYLGAPGSKRRAFHGGRGGQEKIVLPTKFLLGGNINDPLNLNSLSDEAINKALNESTPKSSPLAVPYHRQHVRLVIPQNLEDPLGLNSGDDLNILSSKAQGKKKRKNKYKKKNHGDRSDATEATDGTNISVSLSESKDLTTPVHIEIFSDSELLNQSEITPKGHTLTSTPVVTSNIKQDSSITAKSGVNYPDEGDVVDHIVSPVIPQPISPKSRRRKRTSSDSKNEGSCQIKSLQREDGDKNYKTEKLSPHRPKFRRQHSQNKSHNSSHGSTVVSPFKHKPKPPGSRHKKDEQFLYGNYNRYYGYRNPDGSQKDDRLRNFKLDWFQDKDVLDIGCNVGHVTMEIAREFRPRKMVGLDIDSTLIGIAKKNIRHYLGHKHNKKVQYPSSLLKSFGPIAALPVKVNEYDKGFPQNLTFIAGNYVLESEELVDMSPEEYDVILALSVTKWIHLNWGDAGLKRCFRRMFKQLRPGGRLILEPQLWPSYKKAKKLTDRHKFNHSRIKLRPEQFREFLLREIGFSTSETLEVPYNKAKGFRRPLLMFTKASTTQPCSRVTTPGRSDTSRGATPRFQIGSSGTATPTLESCSNSATPKYTFSPAAFKMETSPMDTIPEVVTPVSPSNIDWHRVLKEQRSQSAPALLQAAQVLSTSSSFSASETHDQHNTTNPVSTHTDDSQGFQSRGDSN